MMHQKEVNKDEALNIKLSLLEKDEEVMSKVQKEILEEELDELVPIKEGQVNVAGVYAYDLGDKYEVKAYLRNGMKNEINFEKIPFKIINSKGEILASQTFDLKAMGNIPSYSARPWILYFDKKNVLVDKIPMDDWKLVFDNSLKALRNLTVDFENLLDGIDDESKKVYTDFLEELQPLKEGEVSFSKFSIGINEQGYLLVTIVIRNGCNKGINIEKLPMTIKDQEGNIVVSEMFELNDLKVSPMKAKVCNFAFPLQIKEKASIPLDSWQIEYNV
ncbi:SLAP domain-containing protein [Clostridium tepidum]|uniref:SLAP domain-containing protein n=1 Tax=Clostridium tepidum TaxID=1962263 RepID=A0ABX3L6R6_9CLOT|nr:SLAP domain-containing protein [Clostridium tepidum]MDU6877237.1 SLAP domain-containing protein [Clostridium botulinum]OOO63102.1 SLAP domain-containing protein [Clostridium tepidum]